ncbi:hypothetical protein MAIT1_03869 [Magnetofaba australis IT-1]|uniref:Uncharacterized protein n=1 Tax=Magnetofaba australis IT-1 TaxID=1434232 RepID=A0A1Y2KBA0_9PROT|nr:hypothetical protein MAIT1_03869 [Magnetofaba australis IT-1]
MFLLFTIVHKQEVADAAPCGQSNNQADYVHGVSLATRACARYQYVCGIDAGDAQWIPLSVTTPSKRMSCGSSGKRSTRWRSNATPITSGPP